MSGTDTSSREHSVSPWSWAVKNAWDSWRKAFSSISRLSSTNRSLRKVSRYWLARTTALCTICPMTARRLASPSVMRCQGIPHSMKISAISSSLYTALAISGIFSSMVLLMYTRCSFSSSYMAVMAGYLMEWPSSLASGEVAEKRRAKLRLATV